jgi:hypothetical protein
MVFLILEYYFDLSFLLFLGRKGNILSSIPNSKVVLLSFIVLAKISRKKLMPQFLVPKSYKGMTPKINPVILLLPPPPLQSAESYLWLWPYPSTCIDTEI